MHRRRRRTSSSRQRMLSSSFEWCRSCRSNNVVIVEGRCRHQSMSWTTSSFERHRRRHRRRRTSTSYVVAEHCSRHPRVNVVIRSTLSNWRRRRRTLLSSSSFERRCHRWRRRRQKGTVDINVDVVVFAYVCRRRTTLSTSLLSSNDVVEGHSRRRGRSKGYVSMYFRSIYCLFNEHKIITKQFAHALITS